MILGTCPWPGCEEHLARHVVDGIALERHTCEGCGREVWTLLSRVDPWSMTGDDFAKDFERLTVDGSPQFQWRGLGPAPYPFRK